MGVGLSPEDWGHEGQMDDETIKKKGGSLPGCRGMGYIKLTLLDDQLLGQDRDELFLWVSLELQGREMTW